MFFLSSTTKAQFYGDCQTTFLVRKDCVCIIYKVNRGVYLTVEVHQRSGGRLLLACAWGEFFERLKRMRNREEVLRKLKRSCPRCANIFTNTVAPHFSYLGAHSTDSGTGLKAGYVVKEITLHSTAKGALPLAEMVSDKVVEAAVELMKYNLELQVEIEEKCPFPQWKHDLQLLMKG